MWALAIPSTRDALTAVIVLLLLGIALSLINKKIAIAEPFYTLIQAVILIVAICWLFRFFGLW